MVENTSIVQESSLDQFKKVAKNLQLKIAAQIQNLSLVTFQKKEVKSKKGVVSRIMNIFKQF